MKSPRVLAAGFAALVGAAGASAQIFQIDDLNASSRFSLGNQAGQFDWTINGIDHLAQQWFWYRADGDTFERSIDTMALIGANVTDTNPFTDPRPDSLSALYREGQARLQ